MRLPAEPNLPQVNDLPALKKRITELWRHLATQVNGLSEGAITAHHQAQSTAPTSGTYKQGDYVRNSTPTEQGAAGAKYILLGWVCVAGGTPGTWRESRTLTGN